MRKYIDADKLIAQIDKRLSMFEHGMAYDCWASCKKVVESLQQEQPEVDLEKAFAHEYAIYHLPNFIIASIVDGTKLIDFIYKTARHFYELGLNARKEK